MTKTIDSTVYRRVWQDLVGQLGTSAGELPLPMTQPPDLSHESGQCAAAFVRDVSIGNAAGFHSAIHLLTIFLSFGVTVDPCAETLAMLAQYLDNPASGAISRAVPAAWYSLLLNCSTPAGLPAMPDLTCTDHAFLVLFFEAGLRAGLSPNAAEGQGKRAAHLHFGLMRKKMYSATDLDRTTIAACLWSAWVAAQSTEGVREQRLTVETSPVMERFETGPSRAISLMHTMRPPVLVMVSESDGQVATPASTFAKLAVSSLFLETAATRVAWAPVGRAQPVVRKHIRGWRHEYRGTANGTVVCTARCIVLLLESTTYRIDILHPLDGNTFVFDCLRLRIPTGSTVVAKGSNRYKSNGGKTTVIELLENPLQLALREPGRADFLELSTPAPFALDRTVQMVSAWCSGNAVTDINRTHLLGIYDL